jgi:hypothetical protein
MGRTPNEEPPKPPVPDHYVPTGGTRHPVQTNETWISIAALHSIDPWDLIDFNFPGLKGLKLVDFKRATHQTNWYLREYVGCKFSKDGENYDFTSGLKGGKGVWKDGHVYIPPKAQPVPVHKCSPLPTRPPTQIMPLVDEATDAVIAVKEIRRPKFYRPLNDREQAIVRSVFGPTLPRWETIGIGDGLGFDGRPWTSTGPAPTTLMPELHFQINLGEAASADLTSKVHANCFVPGVDGTLADLLVHEMTHVWQYHNTGSRYRIWASSLAGSYTVKVGSKWNDYDVEQQATLVEKWFHDGGKKTDPIYPYIRLVVRSGRLDHPRTLTFSELNRDLAYLRARGED